MKLPARSLLLMNGAALGILLWLYLSELLDYFQALSAPVAAMLELPNVGFAAAALGLAFAAAGVTAFGIWTARGDEFKGFRLLPIVAVVLLFIDLFVLSSEKLPISSADHLGLSLQRFQQRAAALASTDQVATDPERLGGLLSELGPPPYLVQGKRLESFQLQLRTGCQGPVREAPGLQVGTLVYCVAEGGVGAWVSAVGLPAEKRFGPPSIFSRGGDPVVALIVPEGADPSSKQGFLSPRPANDGGTQP